MPRSRLEEYRRKRSPESTPEPVGLGGARAGEPGEDAEPNALQPGRFVVQLHAARRRHYDLRLEWGGVLHSWAVPKGPSLDPAEKRFAVATEDHPLEYAEFEGVIPAGNYGAGAMIVWDRGLWVPHLDPEAGLAKGKQLFELHGHKLRGLWTLVRSGRRDGDPNEWLLIKKPDGAATGEDAADLEPGSVLSGLTVEELAAGSRRAEELAAELAEELGLEPGAELGPAMGAAPGTELSPKAGAEPGAKSGARRTAGDAPATGPAVADVQPMLAETGSRPFSRPGWLFELKYDGFRLLAGIGAAAGTAGTAGKAGKAARGATGKAAGTGAGKGAETGAEKGVEMAAERAPETPAGRRPVRLLYRSGRDATAAFPDLVRALGALPYDGLVLDGEVVVLDEEARPSFSRLQRRARLTRRPDLERAAVELPAVYYAFDLLACQGHDLRPLPLERRKELLRRVLPRAGPVRFADHVEERGEELYAAVEQAGVEGLVAKRADSPYRGGRTSAWRKVKADRTEDYVVIGYTPSRGGSGFRLHLGCLEEGRMVSVGRVGTGFTRDDEREIVAGLAGLERRDPPLSDPSQGATARAGTVWVEPRQVVEVRSTEDTAAGQLRHPVFVRMRPDKRPEDCARRPAVDAAPADAAQADAAPADPPLAGVAHPEAGDRPEEPPPSTPDPEPAPRRRTIRITNRDKVFWPAGDGTAAYTKGDLLDHYRTVAPWLLPYLTDRPLVLDRYPDGIAGKSFFQKNAPEAVPEWVRTEAVWSAEGGSETRYFVCDDEETLAYLVNLGTIPFHVVSSRVGSLQTPDWCILDLDAKHAPFASVVEVARAIRRLCEEAGLPAGVKTSGATGLHVLLPLGGRLPHEGSRQLAELLARLVVAELPEIASVARLPASRRGQVYVDYLQNGYGKLLVAPYSVRPLPGAPVSTPLDWDEVDERLDPARFTIATLPARLAARAADPLRVALDATPDLGAALARLTDRLAG